MMRKSRRIFKEKELYKFCLAEVSVISSKELCPGAFHWYDFLYDEELYIKYEKLSEAGQKSFNKELRRVANKLKTRFDYLDDLLETTENEEYYQNLQQEKDSIMNEVAYELKEFLFD